MDIINYIRRARHAEAAAHTVLSSIESSPSRVIHLEELSKKLSGTPVDVQDYFKEAVVCLETGSFRAAIVMSWAGHFFIFLETLFQKNGKEIRAKMTSWKFKDASELRESYPEYQLLEVGKKVKFIKQAQFKVLVGQLSRRNQCAHPTTFKPSMNVAIGYVDEMISQTLDYLDV